MRTPIIASLVCGLLVACETTPHDDQVASKQPTSVARAVSPPPNMVQVMHAKVAAASTLLEAIASSNYDRVANSADELRRISLDSGFMAQDTLAYRTFASHFREEVTKLAADARRADQAAIEADYHRVTESCFECHGHVRSERFQSDMPGRTGM
jgi:hypothetical protein